MENWILIKDNDADLLHYPASDRKHSIKAGVQLTIGDLHGNALKFIYFLIRQNILILTSSQYEFIVNIYYQSVDKMTQMDLKQFNQIIDSAAVNLGAMIRLIGDEVADRGQNDYFTLKILEKLSKEKIPIHILLSNHGNEFLQAYEHFFISFETQLGFGQDQSLVNLGLMVAKDLIQKSELISLVEKYYLPNIKLLDYAITAKDQIRLYTHAPVGLNTIKSLAMKLNISYKDFNIQQLAQTIDEINQKSTILEQLLQYSQSDDKEVMLECASIAHPFIRLLWTRRSNKYYALINDQIDPMRSNHTYEIIYVHGHDGGGISVDAEKIINLDNYFGKGNETKGVYTIEYLPDVLTLNSLPSS